MDFLGFAIDLAQKFAVEAIFGLAALVVAGFAGWIGTYRSARKRIEEAESRVTRVKDQGGEREGRGVWLSRPIRQPDRYDLMIRGSKPVLVFGNLKGGVGKTTMAANLAAHYAMKKSRRVLVIDADYQGSISSMILRQSDRIPSANQDSRATRAFGGLCGGSEFRQLSIGANQPDMVEGLSIRCIPAYYDLAQAENRLLIEWVIKAGVKRDNVNRVGERDIRYLLTELLHSQSVADDYDMVVIDAPPRLTAACVQSLTAATHLVIPTILDGLSSEAVASFVGQVKTLRDEGVCPHLKFAGVVPYVPARAVNFRQRARLTLEALLAESGTEVELLGSNFEIGTLAHISESAGESIAYASMGDNEKIRAVRTAFDRLGDELDRRIRPR